MPHMVTGSTAEQFCSGQFSNSRKELCLYPNHLQVTTLQKRVGQLIRQGHDGCLSSDRMEDILASIHWLAGNAVALVCNRNFLKRQTFVSDDFTLPECCEVQVYI